jgi:hypothetical protein
MARCEIIRHCFLRQRSRLLYAIGSVTIFTCRGAEFMYGSVAGEKCFCEDDIAPYGAQKQSRLINAPN